MLRDSRNEKMSNVNTKKYVCLGGWQNVEGTTLGNPETNLQKLRN